MNTIHIAICINDGYVMPGSVLIQSIGANKGSEQIMIHVISLNELTEKTRSVLNAQAEKNGMKLEYRVFKVPDEIIHSCIIRKNYWSPEIFAKLFISSVLPELSKVLVMDGDMIVRHSLLDLWNVDISEYSMAGVVDCGFLVNKEVQSDMCYDAGYGYLNAGLLLLNLDYHRSHNLQQKYLAWMDENLEKILFQEQTIINNVNHDSKLVLPLKYNLQFRSYLWKQKQNRYYSYEERAAAYFDPTIIHFIGPIKPWHRHCPNPYANEWDRYLKHTSFRGFRKEPQNRSLALRDTVFSNMLWLNGRMLRFLRIFKCRWI